MAVSDDRKYTKAFVHALLEGVKGKTLGEVDKSHQFARTEKSEKITGIAGDVIEHLLFFNTCTTRSRNSILKFPIQRTNRMANLLCGQTYASLSRIQTNGLTEELYHQGSVNTLARCLGHSLMHGASAPS
jgi:hypothetical protein